MEEEQESKESKEIKSEKSDFSEMKNSKIFKGVEKNPWKIVAIILAIVSAILLFLLFRGGITGNITGSAINSGDAAQKIIDFAKSRGADATLVEVNDLSGLYEVVVSIQGQQLPLYVTKDGKYFSQSLIPLTGQVVDQQQPTTTGYSEEDLANIKEFSNCLAEKGLKVYGAGWCGHCQNLIEYFGGEEAISPIFIECSDAQRNPTENAGLCEKEGITGYPTIKIDGESYTGARTFEAFAEATGCSVPDISI